MKNLLPHNKYKKSMNKFALVTGGSRGIGRAVCIELAQMGYQVIINRQADDSLRMVQDETGQKFVDNRITLRIIRADGSVFFSRSFTKSSFDAYLDGDYREGGILEGFVFDKVDGARLVFASSVCLPQTDEYIPLVVTVSSQGEVAIRRDSQLDTNGDDDEEI